MGVRKSPKDFFDALPVEVQREGYVVCPQGFLEDCQRDLTDTGFRGMLALAGEVSPTEPVYRHPVAWLLPEKNKSSKATKAIRELKKAGFLVSNKDGEPIDTSPYWARFPNLGAVGGPKFNRVSRWLLDNHKALGWTARNLRVFVVLSSYFYDGQQVPFLSGARLGRILGVSKAQAAEDLKSLVENAGLDTSYPANSKVAYGYGFTSLLRKIEAMVVAPPSGSGPAVATTAPASPEVLDDDGSSFFGVADTIRANRDPDYLEKRGGGAGRRKQGLTSNPAPSAAPGGVRPEATQGAPQDEALYAKADQLAGPRLLQAVDVVREEFRDKAQDIAEIAATGGRLTEQQRLWLYRTTVQYVLREKWKPATGLHAFAVYLDAKLDPPRFPVSRVTGISAIYFNRKLDRSDALDIARRSQNEADVIALMQARGHVPVRPLPTAEEVEQERAQKERKLKEQELKHLQMQESMKQAIQRDSERHQQVLAMVLREAESKEQNEKELEREREERRAQLFKVRGWER